MKTMQKNSFVFLLLGIFVFLFAQDVWSTPSSNLLGNPGFEDGAPEDFLYWNFSPSNSSCSRQQHENAWPFAHTGLRFLATGRTTDYPNCLSVWQEVIIAPQVGQPVTAGFWLRNGSNSTPPESQNIVIALWAIGPNAEATSKTVTITDFEWGCHQLWLTPTKTGNNRFKIEIYLDSTWNMDVHVDDMYLGLGQIDYCNTAPPYNTAWLTNAMLVGETNTPVEDIRYFLQLQNSCLAQPIQDADGVTIDVPQLIYNAATTYQINPKVLLATMQKEQSAITLCPTNSALRLLMGAGSPSTARAQIDYAASLFRSYHDDLNNNGQTISGWKVGVPKITQDGVTITPATKAIAGQFTYTPYAGKNWGGDNTNIGGVWLFWNAWNNMFNFNEPLPSPSTNTGYLNVRYVDQVFVQKAPENGYWNHCGPASTAMLLYYEGKETRDVLYNRQATLDLVCKVKKNCKGPTWAYLIVATLEEKGLDAHYDADPTFDEIRQSIDNGHPVILSINQASHIVTVVGYSGNNKILINDPYGDTSWWNYSYPTKRNVPFIGAPQTKGEEREYIYGQNLSGKYAIFIDGSVNVAQNSETTWGDTFTNGNTTVDLGSVAQLISPDIENSNIENVYYSPKYYFEDLSTDQSVILEAFEITATDTVGNIVSESSEPFSVIVKFDSNLSFASGFTDNIGNFVPSHQLKPKFTVLHWVDTLNQWQPVDAMVDFSTNEITFVQYSFGKYAVTVSGEYPLYLPTVLR